MKLDKEKIQENFEEFMFYIDDTLADIRQKASQQGYHLDMSMESLKDLAEFIRENDVKNDPENIENFFSSWVYLGEFADQRSLLDSWYRESEKLKLWFRVFDRI